MAKYKTPDGNICVSDEAFMKEHFDSFELIEEDKPVPNPAKELIKNDNWSQKERDDALRLILEKLG